MRPATAALVVAIAVLVSGPIDLAIVQLVHPQPAWTGPAPFVASYHGIQTLPFFSGFALIGGFVFLFAGLGALAPAELRIRAAAAQMLVSAFAALGVFNYLVQTTFVPMLVDAYTPANDAAIGTFSMANPRSLAWSVEMWAYAVLGVATWLVGPVFGGSRLERATAWTFAINGPVSVASAVLTAIVPAWPMTTGGLIAFMAWNALVAAMAILAFLALRLHGSSEVRASDSR